VQQQPTPERYREIQQALAERGYFAGEPDGKWGPDSVEALKSFQRDQNLEGDGKLGALSIIALGLGPRRDGSSAPPASSPAAAGDASAP
jgi:peptidoglycan hydrolase-like protein with peptidoglycan-binding domain